MKATTKQWLDLASTDLKCCKNNLHDSYVTNIIVFHAQQAVEKTFKALFEELDFNIPKIHNLVHLHGIIESYLKCAIDVEILEIFDNVYTSSRYPGDAGMLTSGKPTQKEAKELYEGSKHIHEEIVETIQSLSES